MEQDNRESWLNRMVTGMAPLFETLKTPPAPCPARLDTDGETTLPKNQAARLLKCECEACGYTVRTAYKWLETVGAPLCPFVDHGPMSHASLNGDEDAEMDDGC